jgi:hypothetical protein
MQLEQYVSEILTSGLHPTGFPDYLDIPKVLVDYAGDRDMVFRSGITNTFG